MKRRYPLGPRANSGGNGFWGCPFCHGVGCLACPKASDKAYQEAFPDGPRPILTIKAEPDPSLAVLQDDGCPNVAIPEVFPAPEGDDALSRLMRTVIAMARLEPR